jgi:hypothetical protein
MLVKPVTPPLSSSALKPLASRTFDCSRNPWVARETLLYAAPTHRLLLGEGHLSRRLFGSMLRMIAALPLPDG